MHQMTKAGGTPHRRQTLNKLLQRAAVRDAAGRGGSKGASVNTQVDRKRQVYDIAYMWNKKKTYLQNRNTNVVLKD